MDLDSELGTYLNNEKLEGARYYELLERDILKFGDSAEEFVLMCK